MLTDAAVMEQSTRKQQEDIQRLRQFCLMDDEFMTKCFEDDTACIQLVLRIVLNKPDLVAEEVRTQVFVENLLHRSVRLDVLAADSAGRKYNIEIQRASRGAGEKRARYNSSMMDVNLLQKGSRFEDLPETYVIFITENDVLGEGRPLYFIERYISGTQRRFEDGTYIVYVNGSYRDSSPVGKLMHDFACTDPDDMHYSILADRVRFFKESKKGVAVMSKIMDDMRKEALEEGMLDVAKRMLSDGAIDPNKIAEYVQLPVDAIRQLQAAQNA